MSCDENKVSRVTGYISGDNKPNFKHDSLDSRYENCKLDFKVKVKGMRLKRKIELTFYSIFSIITFHKYYICEDCHKIHKRTRNEFEVCGGWYKHHVFVSKDCAKKTIDKARRSIQEMQDEIMFNQYKSQFDFTRREE